MKNVILGRPHNARTVLGDVMICPSEDREAYFARFNRGLAGTLQFFRLLAGGSRASQRQDAVAPPVAVGLPRSGHPPMTGEHGLSPQDAYLLRSMAADLRISETVDAPNWRGSLYLPRSIFN